MKIFYSDFKSLEKRVLRAREEAIANSKVIDYISFTLTEWDIIRHNCGSLVIDYTSFLGRRYGINIIIL